MPACVYRPLNARPGRHPGVRPGVRMDQRGVTLVELLVGMAIGLFAVLLITQVAILFDSQKRNTTSGADAQINGAVALHTLQRDLQAAGFGLTAGGGAGCLVRYKLLAEGRGEFRLTAAVIRNGDDGAPDELTLHSSAGKDFALPLKLKGHRRDATQFDLDGAIHHGIRKGDLLLAVPQNFSDTLWCNLFNASADRDNAALGVVKHEAGTDGPWNHEGAANPGSLYAGVDSTAVNFPPGSHLLNIGVLRTRVYSIAGNSLQRSTREFSVGSANTATPEAEAIQPQVVDLQAVYGKDSNADRIADTWNNTPPTTPAEWAQIVAIRVAVVARSSHFEKQAVTNERPNETACSSGPAATGNYPVWSPDGSTWACLSVPGLDSSEADKPYTHYRYKVFETLVPLRNMLWQS
jgi:type IV pilus assembly protein PilW